MGGCVGHDGDAARGAARGHETGPAKFAAQQWHTVELRVTASTITATLNGVQLAQGARLRGAVDRFAFKVSLSSYVYAAMDNWSLE